MIAAAMNATMLAVGSADPLLQAFSEGSLGVSFGIAGEPMDSGAIRTGSCNVIFHFFQ